MKKTISALVLSLAFFASAAPSYATTVSKAFVNNFSIAVKEPDAGTVWKAGTTKTVRWDYPNGVSYANVRQLEVILVPVNIPGAAPIVAGGQFAGTTVTNGTCGSYLQNCTGTIISLVKNHSFTIPAALVQGQPFPAGDYQIRVDAESSDATGKILVTGISAGTVNITAPTVPVTHVHAPTAHLSVSGAKKIGSTLTLSLTTNAPAYWVNYVLLDAAGNVVTPIATKSSNLNSSVDWVIPATVQADAEYKIAAEVVDSVAGVNGDQVPGTNTLVVAKSNGFTIKPTAAGPKQAKIVGKVTLPAGKYHAGDSLVLNVTSNANNYFSTITVASADGTPTPLIIAQNAASGPVTWLVPSNATLPPGTYKLILQLSQDSSGTAFSPNVVYTTNSFKISPTPPPAVSITSCTPIAQIGDHSYDYNEHTYDFNKLPKETTVHWSAVVTPVLPDNVGYNYVWSGTSPLMEGSGPVSNYATYHSSGTKTAKLTISLNGKTQAKINCQSVKILASSQGAAVFDAIADFWDSFWN